jgi:alpha-D-ribose 1-methylphosphonate 5-triphosphate diphosphatase
MGELSPDTFECRAIKRRGNMLVRNADVLTPSGILGARSVVVRGGRIEAVLARPPVWHGDPSVDAGGKLLIPGLIDLHSDALEKVVEPRPGTLFPVAPALLTFDRSLTAYGITTMFHCVGFVLSDARARSLRSNEAAKSIVESIGAARPFMGGRALVHARYDIPNGDAAPVVCELIENHLVQLVSLMDHTPGQGQFSDREAYRHRMTQLYASRPEALKQHLAELEKATRRDMMPGIRMVVDACRRNRIPIASHDDDSEAGVRSHIEMGVGIAEFPVNYQALGAARHAGMHIALGAPNIVLGGSHSGNIGVEEAVGKGYGDILCSDYAPSSLLAGAFLLHERGVLELEAAIAMVTLNPARAANMDHRFGSIEEGRTADLVLLDRTGPRPDILMVLVDGCAVYAKA